MFYPLSLFIGLRYVRSRRGFFVSFISWVSMLGVCVGVAALIVVLSVMNGFEAELRSRLLNATAHATLSAPPLRMQTWQQDAARIRALPDVVGVAPFTELQVMVGRSAHLAATHLRGVIPALEPQVSDIDRHLLTGQLAALQAGSRNIVLGSGLAWELQVQPGDELTVLVPDVMQGGPDELTLRPRLQRFVVSGIFELGVPDSDNGLALVHLEDAAALVGAAGVPQGLRLKFADIFAAPSLAPQIAHTLGRGFTVSDWSKENATYFRAVRIEKTMMAIMLMLIVAVAAFNIVAALIMVVNEKRTDVAILRTLGLPAGQVTLLFVIQGLIIGWVGTMLGVSLGLLLALNVHSIVPWIEYTFNIHIMDPAVYYITEIPSQVHGLQVVYIAGMAMLLTVLATLYPARRAMRIAPADALRYE